MRPLVTMPFLSLLLVIALAGCGPLSPMGWWKFQDGVAQTTPFNDGVTQTTPLVTGQVLLASGAPAADVLVKAYSSDVRASTVLPKPLEVRTDAAGRYRLVDPPRGLNTIEAEASEHSKAIRLRVAVAPGDRLALDPLILQPTGTLVGQVSAEGIKDLIGTMVFIPGTRYLAVTDSNGAYTMSHVPAGTYELAAMRPSFATTVVTGVAVKSAETVQAPPIALRLDAPVLASLSRSNGGPDTEITLRGENFGDPKSTQLWVTFGDVLVTSQTHLSDTEIRVRVPEKARSGPVVVRANGVESNALPFQVIAVLKVSPYYAGLYLGDRQQFQVEARDAFGQFVPDPFVTWQLGSTILGTLEGNGELRTHDAGWSEVRATSGAATGLAAVGVTPFSTRVAGLHAQAPAGSAGNVVARSEGLYYTHPAGDRLMFCDGKGGTRVLVGKGERGYSPDGTPALEAKLNQPEGLAVDDQGNLFFSERGNHVVRVVTRVDTPYAGRILEAGKIHTLAGKRFATLLGDGGPAVEAALNMPAALAFAGNEGFFQGGSLLVVDTQHRRIRAVAADGTISSLVGGGGLSASLGGIPAGDYGGSIDYQLARDGSGNLAFAAGHQLLFFARRSGTYFGRSMSAGRLYVVGGQVSHGFDGDGPAAAIRLWNPDGLAFDSRGNLFFAEGGTGAIRVLTAEGGVRWVAGLLLPRSYSTPPMTTEVAPATSVKLSPYCLAVREDGTLLVGDEASLQFHELTPYRPWRT